MKKTVAVIFAAVLALLAGCANSLPEIPEYDASECVLVTEYNKDETYVIPKNYKPVINTQDLYAVLDENDFITGYKVPIKDESGYTWKSVSISEIFK